MDGTIYRMKGIVQLFLGFLFFLHLFIQLSLCWFYSDLLPAHVVDALESNGLQHGGINMQSRQKPFSSQNLAKRRISSLTIEKLQNSGLNLSDLDQDTIASIPDWTIIESTLGSSKPHILGLNTCEAFKSIVRNKPRYIGVSGLFNSGTNVLAYLLEENCELEETGGEVLWQVPWGKHALATRRDLQIAPGGYDRFNKTRVLPAVIVRNPFEVLDSMCRNSYSVRYSSNATSTCPHMVDHGTGELLPVEVGKKNPRTRYPSIAHFWNQWYREYLYDFPYPRLLIRLEDLTVHPKETVRAVCECAGGRMVEGFRYLLTSAKKGMGHGEESEKNGMIEAWARIGRSVPFSLDDYEAAQTYLDPELMGAFRYKPPPRQEH